MRIHALTVCVNYADLIAPAIERWKSGADSVTVITTESDRDTIHLCSQHSIPTYRTNVFYDKGAHFNKGSAIAECVEKSLSSIPLNLSDWFLFFDADIIPPRDWRVRVEMAEPRPGGLYGAPRHDLHGRRMNDPFPAGYFLLFNSQDQNALIRPIVDTHWTHAGNYDTTFIQRWKRPDIHWMPIPLSHTGDPAVNWCGRGNTKAMQELIAERRRRRDWRHEKIME